MKSSMKKKTVHWISLPEKKLFVGDVLAVGCVIADGEVCKISSKSAREIFMN